MNFSHSPHQQQGWWRREGSGSKNEKQPQEQLPPSRFAVGSYAYRPLADVPQRLHVLGTGSIGKLVAHSLRSLPQPPPVTLIFHKFGLVDQWKQEKESIKITTDGITEAKSGYDIEVAVPPEIEHGRIVKPNSFRPNPGNGETSVTNDGIRLSSEPDDRVLYRHLVRQYDSDEQIHNLIVSVKAWQTVAALLAVRHRLTLNSTVCFLQNGMGIMDEVNEKVFPDEDTRPTYMMGIVTHGVHADVNSSFSATHAGLGTIQLGIIPRYARPTPSSDPAPQDSDSPTESTSLDPRPSNAETLSPSAEKKEVLWSTTSRYMLRTLTRVPVLCAVGLSPSDLLVAQLEKLAVNCIVNPLTVLLDCRNGSLLFNYALSRTMRLLLGEISLVLRELPELQGTPNLRLKFSPDRLETLVVSVANATAENISSMLADVRAGRQTEIEYMNGYVVRRGEEMGIRCAMNYLVMQLVQGKKQITGQEMREEVPMLGSEEEKMETERAKL